MLELETDSQRIRKTNTDGPWFLIEWRTFTNHHIPFVDILDSDSILVELEGNIIRLNINDVTINGEIFIDVEQIKNYLLNG